MKPILTTLLLVATLSAGAQVATTAKVDSIITAHIDTDAMHKSLSTLTYYPPATLAQIMAIVNAIPASAIAPVKGVTFGTPPIVVTSPYKLSPNISLSGVSNQTISFDSIQCGAKPGIQLTNCTNIAISNCKLYNGTNVAIYLQGCSNITINGCFLTNVSSGLYALQCNNTIFTANQVLNVVGPLPRGQAAQFDKCTGGQVTNNLIQNNPGVNHSEDVISMYMSNGSAANPIIISGNEILGGGGTSANSGGIMLGDKGGSFETCTNNKLVSPGQYGCAVAGGTNMTVSNNQIYSAKTSISNVGLYVWNQSGLTCSTVAVSGNLVNWTSKSGSLNPGWNGGGCTSVTGNWNPNTTTSSVTAAILPSPLVVLH